MEQNQPLELEWNLVAAANEAGPELSEEDEFEIPRQFR